VHLVTLRCNQEKEAEKDPPFQKPKSKGRATPTRKDKFKIVLANEECPTRHSVKKAAQRLAKEDGVSLNQ
jgi:hypothetical protein